jgi:hypothetical protein
MDSILTKDGLKALGFRGFWRVRDLQNEKYLRDLLKLEDLNQRGIYAVVCSQTYQPSFIGKEEALGNDNVKNPYPEEKLKERWVQKVEVLYFGITGTSSKSRTLREKITELVRHSQGKKKNHRSGDILWQLRGFEGFKVGYKFNDNPIKEESMLIHEFIRRTGKQPFANRYTPITFS